MEVGRKERGKRNEEGKGGTAGLSWSYQSETRVATFQIC